jgi:hypothetical protein
VVGVTAGAGSFTVDIFNAHPTVACSTAYGLVSMFVFEFTLGIPMCRASSSFF